MELPAGLVNLADFPLLRDYLKRHSHLVKNRNVAKKNQHNWFRKIDRVNESLRITKLYIADIKNELNPVLDNGQTYPHHNLYYIQFSRWALDVLGGIFSPKSRAFLSNPTASE